MLQQFWFAFGFGFLLVFLVSIEVFDTPTYLKRERDAFRKFRPSFVTFNRLYARALFIYLLLMEFIYVGLSFSPSLADTVLNLGEGVDASSPAYPLLAASVLVGFQNAFLIKEVERRLRKWLHRWAKIPHGARTTVAELRRSDFLFEAYADPLARREPELTTVDEHDIIPKAGKGTDPRTERILKKWARICCVLYNLRASRDGDATTVGGFDASCYDDNFFDEYDEEYNEIRFLHRGLANAISRFKQQKDTLSPGNLEATQEAIESDLNELLTRVYCFTACAVRSRQKKESEVITALNALGFRVPSIRPVAVDILGVLTLCAFAALISLLGAYFVEWQFAKFESGLVAMVRYIPKDPVERILWPVSTFLYFLAAIWVCLSYRSAKVERKVWVARDGGLSSRPYLRYIWASALAGCAAFLVLSVLGFAELYINWERLGQRDPVNAVAKVLVPNAIWIVVAAIAGWSVLYYRDASSAELTAQRRATMIAVQAVAMGGVAYLSTELYCYLWLTFSDIRTGPFDELNRHYSGVIAVLVAVIGAMIGYYFSRRRIRQYRLEESWLGRWRLDTEKGDRYVIDLYPDGHATTNLYANGQGTWKLDDDQARIAVVWSSGWTDFLVRSDTEHRKIAYRTGNAVHLDPTEIVKIVKEPIAA